MASPKEREELQRRKEEIQRRLADIKQSSQSGQPKPSLPSPEEIARRKSEIQRRLQEIKTKKEALVSSSPKNSESPHSPFPFEPSNKTQQQPQTSPQPQPPQQQQQPVQQQPVPPVPLPPPTPPPADDFKADAPPPPHPHHHHNPNGYDYDDDPSTTAEELAKKWGWVDPAIPVPYDRHWVDIPPGTDKKAFRSAVLSDLGEGKYIYVRYRKALCRTIDFPLIWFMYVGEKIERHRSFQANPEMFSVKKEEEA